IPVPNDILNSVADSGSSEFVQARLSLNKIDSVLAGSAADKAGLLPGDSILQLAGQPVQHFDEFQNLLASNKNKEIDFVVNRQGEEVNFQVAVPADGVLGVIIPNYLPFETAHYGFLQSLPIGASKAWGS